MSGVPLSVQKLTKRFEAGTVNEKLPWMACPWRCRRASSSPS